jgi:hypothetical protein
MRVRSAAERDRRTGARHLSSAANERRASARCSPHGLAPRAMCIVEMLPYAAACT